MLREHLQKAYSRMGTLEGRHAMAARIMESQDSLRSEYSQRRPKPAPKSWWRRLIIHLAGRL